MSNIKDYSKDLSSMYDELMEKYHDVNIALNIMHMSVQMYNTDNINKNLSASMTLKES